MTRTWYRNRARLGLVAASCLTLAVTGRTQSTTLLVRDGDAVPGVGVVTSIQSFAVNDAGSWVAATFTDASLDQNLVLLRDGVVQLTENQVMSGTDGFVLQAFDGVSLNIAGDSCWNLFLRGGTPPRTETAIFLNASPVLLVGDPISASGFTPGTTYVSFSEVVFNNTGDAFLIADVDDPQIPGLNDLVAIRLDFQEGALATETSVVRRFDTPSALGGDAVVEIERDPNEIALSDRGEIAYVARTSSGRAALFFEDMVIAREGEQTLEGRQWERLTSRPLDLNANGALLFRAELDGNPDNDEVIVLSDPPGQLEFVLREGDPIETPDGTFRIQDFGGAPIALSDRNDVVAFVDLDHPNPSRDEGIVVNGRLVIQEGVTQVAGKLITSIGNGTPTLFAVSPDGDCLAFRCVLIGFVDALVMVDLSDLPGPFCDASDGAWSQCPCAAGGGTSGCDVARGTGGVRLQLKSQETLPLNRATLGGSGFPAMSATPNVLLRSATLASGPVVFGNGLRCVGLPVTRLGATLAAEGRTTHVFGHGTSVGSGSFYYQLWFRDTPISYCDPTLGFNLSNGQTIRWP